MEQFLTDLAVQVIAGLIVALNAYILASDEGLSC